MREKQGQTHGEGPNRDFWGAPGRRLRVKSLPREKVFAGFGMPGFKNQEQTPPEETFCFQPGEKGVRKLFQRIPGIRDCLHGIVLALIHLNSGLSQDYFSTCSSLCNKGKNKGGKCWGNDSQRLQENFPLPGLMSGITQISKNQVWIYQRGHCYSCWV